MDTAMWLDEVPTVRAHTIPSAAASPGTRAVLAIDPVLTVYGTVDVLRATLVAALAQLDAMEQGQ